MTSLLRSYGVFLERSPFRANMLTGGILWGIGDALCQRLSPPTKPSTPTSISSKSPTSPTSDDIKPHTVTTSFFDYKRLAVKSTFGFLCAGPAYAIWYKALDVSLTKIFYRTDKMRSAAAIGRWDTPWHQSMLMIHANYQYLKLHF